MASRRSNDSRARWTVGRLLAAELERPVADAATARELLGLTV